MFTQEEFIRRVEIKTTPPIGVRKGFIWKLLGKYAKQFIYENGWAILVLLMEHFFGKTKAYKIAQEMSNALGEEDPKPKCDANDPNDPHYGEAGHYNNNQDCIWIPQI